MIEQRLGKRKRCGRTQRLRRRRRLLGRARPRPVCDSEFVGFLRWCHGRGLRCQELAPAVFPETGRGMLAKKTLTPGNILVSVPRTLLVTVEDVLSSEIGAAIRRFGVTASDVSLLAAFLLVEKEKGLASEWWPYVCVLPETYSLPVCFASDECLFLPPSVQDRALSQRKTVKQEFSCLRAALEALVNHTVSLVDFLWAWCAVNTRTVYMSSEDVQRSIGDLLSGEGALNCGRCALAPFLDLLNHSHDAQIVAGFQTSSGCYEIVTNNSYKKGKQAFICYGPHGNDRLLLEYGFILMDNPHSVVCLDDDFDWLLATADQLICDPWLVKRKAALLSGNLDRNVTCSHDGCSWRLIAALNLLVMDGQNLSQWRRFIFGKETLSLSPSAASLGLKLCQHAQLRYHDEDQLRMQRQKPDVSVNTWLAMSLSLEHLKILSKAISELEQAAHNSTND